MKEAFYFVDVGGLRYSHDRNPEVCPLCHHAVEVSQEAWTLVGKRIDKEPKLEIVFRCPRQTCGRLFIGRYGPSTEESSAGHTLGLFVLSEVVPRQPKPAEVPEEVRNISPGFVEIYEQASAAESWGLMQVTGAGYRKSLEFLIKDYCIHTHTNEAEEIGRLLLGACIGRFVDDSNVKECARRAAWLGNDETHYSRRWADKDVTDLKRLIQLTVIWIHSSEVTKQYLADMPQNGSP